MESIRKFLLAGCALAIAGCAQGGLGNSPGALGPGGISALPSAPGAGLPLGRRHRKSGSGGPEIYDFAGTPDAYAPLTGLANIGNTLYGTTQQGGANNLGAVYSVTTGGVEKVIHSFSGYADGQNPEGPLTNVNGTLYGTAYQGGTEHGTVFTIDPSGGYHIVYNFGVKAGDCTEPDSAMIYVPSKNALYGTAYGGGATGEGCIFKLNLASKKLKESVVYSFTGASNSSTEASAPVMYKDALYVTTPGGGANGHGAVLKITLSGQESLVYSFKDDPDGAGPYAPLVVVGNALYGTTIDGGQGACVGYAGCGTVFKVTPAGKETVLHRFTDVVSEIDGTGPQAALIAIGTTLYGTTPNCSGNGCGAGTVFSVTTSGHESVVWDFADTPSSPPGYPFFPYSPVLNVNGTLYGTTASAAQTDYGTVYAIAP